jgi:maleate isomerase
VPELEHELGIPVYDSVSVTVWKALRMTGHAPARVAGWGRLFEEVQ